MALVLGDRCWVHGVADDSAKLVVAFSDDAALTILLSFISKFEFGTSWEARSVSPESVGYELWLTIFLPGTLSITWGKKARIVLN